jgi:hypothetical protein
LVEKFVALDDEIEVSIYKKRDAMNIQLKKPGSPEFDIAADSLLTQ